MTLADILTSSVASSEASAIEQSNRSTADATQPDAEQPGKSRSERHSALRGLVDTAPEPDGESNLDDVTTPRARQFLQTYKCQCGRPVFFVNSRCLACSTTLGYDPVIGRVVPLEAASTQGEWHRHGRPDDALGYRRCANLQTPAACNWLLRSDDAAAQSLGTPYCVACRLNRTIPDLSIDRNAGRWRRIEMAKRRLVAALIALGLPVVSKLSDPENGLAFDFLFPVAGGPVVMTGHDNGLIVINILEADDAYREQVRTQMGEPYRTLLGHLRHEVGHYYWDRLVQGTDWLNGFRRLFGDETQNYDEALSHHYSNGPAADWQLRHVSAYASMHPWEDWAESWAHYLHMVDTVATALRFGIRSDFLELDHEPFGSDDLWDPNAADADAFLDLVNSWVELTGVLNELSRSMGEHDFYPFVLPRLAVAKLQFVHCVVTSRRADTAAAQDAMPAQVANP
ncbi:putative zinc-binding peptidase [soil metagenome]